MLIDHFLAAHRLLPAGVPSADGEAHLAAQPPESRQKHFLTMIAWIWRTRGGRRPPLPLGFARCPDREDRQREGGMAGPIAA
jgi:hypothetical protein